MGKFLIQTTLFSILVLAGYLFLANTLPISKDYYRGFSFGYMSGIKIKHQRAQAIKQPKIMFVGGSNLAYGIDSEMIEDWLSVPVVNFGHHAGLGLPFILNQAKKFTRKGDIVLISPEYFMGEGDYKLIEQTCLMFPELADLQTFSVKQEVQLHLTETREGLVKFVEGEQVKNEPAADFLLLENRIRNSSNPNWIFNEYGDVVMHLNSRGWYKRSPDETKFQYRYWEGIKSLNEFKAEAKAKGVDVFFTYPPMAKSDFDIEASSIKRFGKDLTNNLDIEILNTPEDLVLDNGYFFDTQYHLTKKGRELRTKTVLRSIMENENARNSVERASKVHPEQSSLMGDTLSTQ